MNVPLYFTVIYFYFIGLSKSVAIRWLFGCFYVKHYEHLNNPD